MIFYKKKKRVSIVVQMILYFIPKGKSTIIPKLKTEKYFHLRGRIENTQKKPKFQKRKYVDREFFNVILMIETLKTGGNENELWFL